MIDEDILKKSRIKKLIFDSCKIHYLNNEEIEKCYKVNITSGCSIINELFDLEVEEYKKCLRYIDDIGENIDGELVVWDAW